MKNKIGAPKKKKGALGGEEAIQWIIVLFLAGILGGATLYTLAEFDLAVTDANASRLIQSIISVFDVIPTWLKILVIVGFASAIALVGISIYKMFKSSMGGM